MEPVKSLRFDIQFLRGIAVLLVVLFHGFGLLVPRGFLGVDIFFVVSGYLITLMILKGLNEGNFSFLGFYLRRAKRLLPAAYSTFLVTTLLAYAFLTSVQWHAYIRQLAGALTFTANIVLARQTGYFEADAETKPLLHIWSLSLEEQFYFVIPLLLWALATRWRGVAIGLAAVLSFALCLFAVSRSDWQSLAFYMLPTRAWELLAGSMIAWLRIKGAPRAPGWMGWLGLLVIAVIALHGFDAVHPRFDALACVVATAVIVATSGDWLGENALTRPVARLGDWSYSVYLVHWPLFSFAFLAYLGEPPRSLLVGLAVLALLLGWLQYRYVETRFRIAWTNASWRAWTGLAVASAAVALVALPRVMASAASEPFSVVFNPTRGLKGCDGESRDRLVSSECQTSPAPTVAVWGDSNAMHLVPGLAADPAIRGLLLQLTRSACAPAKGIANVRVGEAPDWSEQCIIFNRKALDSMVDSPSLKHVVIGSEFAQLLVNRGQQLLADGVVSPWRNDAADGFVEAIEMLQTAGKTPLLVAPIPWPSFNPGECNLRRIEDVALFRRDSCDFALADANPDYVAVVRQLRVISAKTGAPLYLPETVLCPGGICRTASGGRLIYRDKGHLSEWGSAFVLERLGVLKRLGVGK